jgi:hypothetical protein
LAGEWSQIDLSKYNFFLMPISFYHGFEAVTSSSVTPQPEQIKRLLEYLDSLEEESDGDSSQHFRLCLTRMRGRQRARLSGWECGET